jgi:hypothetical protein
MLFVVFLSSWSVLLLLLMTMRMGRLRSDVVLRMEFFLFFLLLLCARRDVRAATTGNHENSRKIGAVCFEF